MRKRSRIRFQADARGRCARECQVPDVVKSCTSGVESLVQKYVYRRIHGSWYHHYSPHWQGSAHAARNIAGKTQCVADSFSFLWHAGNVGTAFENHRIFKLVVLSLKVEHNGDGLLVERKRMESVNDRQRFLHVYDVAACILGILGVPQRVFNNAALAQRHARVDEEHVFVQRRS